MLTQKIDGSTKRTHNHRPKYLSIELMNEKLQRNKKQTKQAKQLPRVFYMKKVPWHEMRTSKAIPKTQKTRIAFVFTRFKRTCSGGPK